MLLEVSMRMGSKHINNNEVHHVASRRANRQQQRILLQISVVAIIFYLYMFAYYLLYHVLNVSNKWVVLFNSFFYSTTHMINPVIYFSLNKDMRAQLIRAISDFLHWLCCVAGDARLHAAGASSIYGRVKRGGGESSSGGSPLRKSSPNDLNSSAQPGGGWTLRYLVASYCARRTSIVPRDCWNRLSAFIYRQPLQQTKTKNNTKISTAVIQNKDGNYQTSVVALTTEMAEEINGRNAKQNNFDENSDTISSGGGDNLNNNNNRLTPFRVHFVQNYFY